jgi:IstB-like ATP binding protein
VERGLRLARFPYLKTLEQFDFGLASIDRKLVRELAGLGFVFRRYRSVALSMHQAQAYQSLLAIELVPSTLPSDTGID